MTKRRTSYSVVGAVLLAVMDTDRVFLSTCTAPSESFAKHATEFHASLDSLKLVPGK